MPGKALILGGSGRFGRNLAQALWDAGWRVVLHDRAKGDLRRDAEGMDLIVNGWNPAYPNWSRDALPLTRRVIDAARHSGATILFPGNVYVYGAKAGAVFGPAEPQRAENPLGQIRRQTESAYRASGCQVIVLRAGDFLDTEASGNWFDLQMAPSLKKGVLTYPGNPEIAHAWAYLPDLARAAVDLAERRATLPQFNDIAFPGYTLTGAQMAALCAEALNRPVRIRRMAWWPLYLARPFWKLAAPLIEMRYLWDKPHRLDPEVFDALLPDFRPTDQAQALACAIAPILGPGSVPGPVPGSDTESATKPAPKSDWETVTARKTPDRPIPAGAAPPPLPAD